jgi:hypothetical protein
MRSHFGMRESLGSGHCLIYRVWCTGHGPCAGTIRCEPSAHRFLLHQRSHVTPLILVKSRLTVDPRWLPARVALPRLLQHQRKRPSSPQEARKRPRLHANRPKSRSPTRGARLPQSTSPSFSLVENTHSSFLLHRKSTLHDAVKPLPAPKAKPAVSKPAPASVKPSAKPAPKTTRGVK